MVEATAHWKSNSPIVDTCSQN